MVTVVKGFHLPEAGRKNRAAFCYGSVDETGWCLFYTVFSRSSFGKSMHNVCGCLRIAIAAEIRLSPDKQGFHDIGSNFRIFL